MTTPTVNSEPTVEAKRPHCICGTWLHAHENDTGKCLWPDCGCSRFQFAEDAHEPTVEEALRELREMLPEYEGHEEIRIEICISVGYLKWVGSSLSEAMEQARLWNTVHARRFFCSCGGALTAEEYANHRAMGHDGGSQS